MEAKTLLENRDALAREIRERMTGKSTGRRGGGLCSLPGSGRVQVAMTVKDGNKAYTSQFIADSALHYAAESLCSADVVVWKPGIFDAATANREKLTDDRINTLLLPTRLQLWIPDPEAGKSAVWRTMETEAALPTTEPVKLVGIILGLIPFDILENKCKGGIVAARGAVREYRFDNYNPDGDYSPLCPIVYVYRERQSKLLQFHIALLVADRLVVLANAVLAVASALEFMTEQYVTKKLIGTGKKTGTKGPQKPAHRGMVQSVVLREKVLQNGAVTDPPPGPRTSYWYHQWEVRPYTKRLKRPKANGETLVFVKGHRKGPEDKPKLPARERVIQVAR